MSSIREAIQGAGGPAKVAKRLGVTVQAVCFWRDGARALPAEFCIELEKMNEGRVRCEEMMPSADWAYLRDTPITKPKPRKALAAIFGNSGVAVQGNQENLGGEP